MIVSNRNQFAYGLSDERSSPATAPCPCHDARACVVLGDGRGDEGRFTGNRRLCCDVLARPCRIVADVSAVALARAGLACLDRAQGTPPARGGCLCHGNAVLLW